MVGLLPVLLLGTGVVLVGSTPELALLNGLAWKLLFGGTVANPVALEGGGGLYGMCGEAGIVTVAVVLVEYIEVRAVCGVVGREAATLA